MKRFLRTIAFLCIIPAAMAQEATSDNVVAAVDSADPVTIPQSMQPPAPAPAQVVVRDGYVYKMQECGGPTGGIGSRLGNLFSNTFIQISRKTGLDMVGHALAADAVGTVAGNAMEDTDKRKVCVTVAFKDGTPDQDTVLAGKTFDSLNLRYRQTVAVRFEDGKPVFQW